MSKPLQRKQIADQVYFNWITDEKFKNNRLSIHCILPLDPATASDNAMVPLLLERGSKHHPSFATLQADLNRLYGAYAAGGAHKFNTYQRISLAVNCLDNRYAMEKEDLVGSCAKLLSQLFFEPNFDENGVFQKQIVELERQSLIDAIQGEFNEKRTYALNRTTEEMYHGESLATPRLGDLESAKKVTPESITNAWKNMITTAPIEIMFTGSGDPTSAIEVLTKQFQNIERKSASFAIIPQRKIANKPHTVTEEVEGLQQGKLVLGFCCDEELDTPEKRMAFRLCVAAYGGTPFSKLFLNVREKLSLCYYCAARADLLNNMLLVDSGVELENRDAAEKEILAQLKVMQEGNLSEEELTNTKLLMANGFQNVTDSPYSLEGWYISQILQGESGSPEESIEIMNQITEADLVAMSQKISLDTIYFLTGKEEQ